LHKGQGEEEAEESGEVKEEPEEVAKRESQKRQEKHRKRGRGSRVHNSGRTLYEQSRLCDPECPEFEEKVNAACEKFRMVLQRGGVYF
jgi:hypothetical protein